ncbi:MAG: ribonuclease HII [Spirochaetes bacterium GWF1_41_5]|nr:MAG: ribonuclease HII [Spirochaetes bacterium GWF1_41_5]
MNSIKQNLRFFENQYQSVYSYIGGADEAGRGPLAGPVVSAIVILNPDKIDERINDSKKIKPALRSILSEVIKNQAVAYGIGAADPAEIDTINIFQATRLAFYRAYLNMRIKPDFLLTDAILIPSIPLPQKAIIKGDSKSFSIAAASILAKVHRDKIMEQYADEFPQYGFKKHKGYPVRAHIEAIQKYGICRIHRVTFRPIKNDKN